MTAQIIHFPKVNKRTGESPTLDELLRQADPTLADIIRQYAQKREPKSSWDRIKGNLPFKPEGVK